MRIIATSLAVLAVCLSTTRANENYPQIMIRGEFIAVPKAALDNVGRNAPDQLPSASLILGFKRTGQGTVLCSPTILTQPGQEAAVKAVQEVIYPTDLDVTNQVVTNAVDKPMIVTVITPSSLETREVGTVFTVRPELDPQTDDIHLTFQAELVAAPVWKKYVAQYVDSSGNSKTADLEQPFFHVRRVTSSVRIKNGTTVLAGGGMTDEKNDSVTFLLIKSQLVDSKEKQLKWNVEPGAAPLPPTPQTGPSEGAR